jgi:L-fuculose-phosphate aldolase
MTSKEIKFHRKQVASFMRRLYSRGLTTASGGNISFHTGEEILITPSAIDKAVVKGRQIGIMDINGKNLTPDLKLSIESAMHAAIYKVRPDVKAIVHAHPPVATSFTAMQQPINCSLIAEARAILGEPVMAPYALMGTAGLAEVTALTAAKYKPLPNVILLQNHGIVCLGKDLLTAFDRMEVLEAAARMTVLTSVMGSVNQLSTEQMAAIDAMMNSAN